MRIALASLALAVFALSPAQAGGPAKGVVELFTSQGCSSCPPADAAFSSIINRGGYITLAWHVDYWDRLGWKDTFSSPASTARQARYAARIGGGSYTPEFVVNGKRGSSSSDIVSGGGMPVAVNISGGKAKIGSGSGKANIVLVNYSGSQTVPITRGENTGRSITYRHVVTSLRNIGQWDGNAITVSAGGGNCAILLQRPGQGEIIGAAMC
jgi:hypothetical protein